MCQNEPNISILVTHCGNFVSRSCLFLPEKLSWTTNSFVVERFHRSEQRNLVTIWQKVQKNVKKLSILEILSFSVAYWKFLPFRSILGSCLGNYGDFGIKQKSLKLSPKTYNNFSSVEFHWIFRVFKTTKESVLKFWRNCWFVFGKCVKMNQISQF